MKIRVKKQFILALENAFFVAQNITETSTVCKDEKFDSPVFCLPDADRNMMQKISESVGVIFTPFMPKYVDDVWYKIEIPMLKKSQLYAKMMQAALNVLKEDMPNGIGVSGFNKVTY
jgi:hypothetical protein